MKSSQFKSLITAFAVIACFASSVFAADKLVIISPHRKSIQNEYVPAFKEWYKTKFKTDVEIDWLDQGGSNDDVKFIKTKFSTNPKTSGIDVFFGGGTTTHNEISDAKLAETLKLSPELTKQIPKTLGGSPVFSKDGTFVWQAASTFGIFFNKAILKLEHLPEPTTWESLGDPKFKDKLILTDSRKSGTSSVLNHIILESLGWEKGFELLTKISGNTRQFTQMSTDPIKAIVAGDAAATLAIDFYAIAKIGDLGADKLGFTLPEGKSIIEGDPITILKGAPNRATADRFVDFVLSVPGQTILVLPKGAAGGPKNETLGRLAVNSEAYKITDGKRINPVNPFTAKGFMKYDTEKQSKVRKVLDDLIGTQFVDSHSDLKAAWSKVIKAGLKDADIKAISVMPVTSSDLLALAGKWDDGVFRNQKINEWVKFAHDKYAKVAK